MLYSFFKTELHIYFLLWLDAHVSLHYVSTESRVQLIEISRVQDVPHFLLHVEISPDQYEFTKKSRTLKSAAMLIDEWKPCWTMAEKYIG